jgi:hypothetical protein
MMRSFPREKIRAFMSPLPMIIAFLSTLSIEDWIMAALSMAEEKGIAWAFVDMKARTARHIAVR